MIDQMSYIDDPFRAIAEEILAENVRTEIAAPWFQAEIMRRYQQRYGSLDGRITRYLANGGVGGLSHNLLKRDRKIAGLRVPERIYVQTRKVYRPTLICSEDDLRSNAVHLGRSIKADQIRRNVILELADIVHAAGVKRVGDLDGVE